MTRRYETICKNNGFENCDELEDACDDAGYGRKITECINEARTEMKTNTMYDNMTLEQFLAGKKIRPEDKTRGRVEEVDQNPNLTKRPKDPPSVPKITPQGKRSRVIAGSYLDGGNKKKKKKRTKRIKMKLKKQRKRSKKKKN